MARTGLRRDLAGVHEVGVPLAACLAFEGHLALLAVAQPRRRLRHRRHGRPPLATAAAHARGTATVAARRPLWLARGRLDALADLCASCGVFYAPHCAGALAAPGVAALPEVPDARAAVSGGSQFQLQRR